MWLRIRAKILERQVAWFLGTVTSLETAAAGTPLTLQGTLPAAHGLALAMHAGMFFATHAPKRGCLNKSSRNVFIKDKVWIRQPLSI